MELKQKKLFVSKHFRLTKDGIDFKSKDFDGEFSKFIPFKDIEPRIQCRIYTEKFPKLLQGGLVIATIGLLRSLMNVNDDLQKTLIIFSIAIIFGLLTVLAYFIIQIKYFLIELEGDTQLFFILDNPTKEEMQQFIDLIYDKRKENYREQYFYINYNNTKDEETGKMNWLKSEEIISTNEYNVVIDEINEQLA